MLALVLLAALIVLYFYYHLVHKRRGLPPGPTPVPFFGNVLSVIRNPPGEKLFAQWRRQYGKVYTYWMGNFPVVFIADHDLLVETYLKDGDTHAGRPNLPGFEVIIGGPTGMMMIDGDIWREQRRFSIKVFRDLGVMDEILTTIDSCDKSIESGAEEQNLFAETEIAVGSLINSFLFGYRFHGEKRSEFFKLKGLLVKHINALGHPLVQMTLDCPHFYKNLPFFRHYYKQAMTTAADLMDFYSNQIEEHNKDLDHDKESSDYVHAFMNERRRLDDAGETHYFSQWQLLALCYELWTTISSTLSWGFAYLIYNPEAQQKCQEELDRVVGSDQMVTMNDKPNLPYCTAAVEEIYRVANIAPQILLHRTLKDVEIGGYKIKKDTLTMPQFASYFIDGEIFKDPYKFNPDRFIDENGNFKKIEQLIPFGIGKRVCMGESMARTEVFMFVTNILKRYKLSAGKELPSLKRNLGFTVLIEPYLCRMEKRV